MLCIAVIYYVLLKALAIFYSFFFTGFSVTLRVNVVYFLLCVFNLSPNTDGGRSPTDAPCRLVIESEGESPPSRPGRRRSLGGSEPHHVTLIVFGVGMVNRTHLEADIGGLTMEAELKKIHGSFTLKEKMKGSHTHYALMHLETT